MATAAMGGSPIHPGERWVPGSLVTSGTRRVSLPATRAWPRVTDWTVTEAQCRRSKNAEIGVPGEVPGLPALVGSGATPDGGSRLPNDLQIKHE
jgi:hypothetical protein